MSRLLNRRRFMLTGSSAIASGALSTSRRASAQSSGALRVQVYGGDFGKALIEAYVKPFEAETGIKVIPITQDVPTAQIAMMVKSKNVTIDVSASSSVPTLVNLVQENLLEDIDYSIYKEEELAGIPDYCKQTYGVASYMYSYNMVYNTAKFPAGKPRPANWADFWDVKQFPGVRSLLSGQYGTIGPWEEAVLADGAAVDALYPMDIDRIFASLDKIKPYIVKWWTNGSEIQQIMRDGVADIMESYDGRALLLADQGSPIEINRNQARLTWDYWFIPKGSPNAQNAQKFIEFTTRADRQAAFVQFYPQAPSNRNAFKLIPEKAGRKLCSHPDYIATSYPINPKWYIETGSNGLTNAQQLLRRWNKWIL
ncbi:ABC transporter substrate-binding protein [Bradyrhizobium sp. 177]|uniref:ABC transporter substrate-binding protein n=1 Tax=Bradyrhizobium sp. 177 TaxID=2782647 RepID=UPI001FF6FE10|nr:ABC transporter substrate-binding protein [Bradyrhizobium sp. 177]MCK1551937.1 ABC transporter substrate-binding protein [Bradyrhizobium sp. 177]